MLTDELGYNNLCRKMPQKKKKKSRLSGLNNDVFKSIWKFSAHLSNLSNFQPLSFDLGSTKLNIKPFSRIVSTLKLDETRSKPHRKSKNLQIQPRKTPADI